jgi:O-antigen/teichoic acid export membrane protein
MAISGRLSSGPGRRLASDAALTGGAAIVSTGLGAVSSLIIARELGPAGRGVWGVAASSAVLAGTALSIGLPTATAYAAARLEGPERAGLLRAAFVVAWVLGAAAAVAAAVVVLASLPAETVALPLLAAAIAAGLLVNLVGHQALLTAAPLRWYALVQIAPGLLMLAVVIVLSVADAIDVTAVAAASAGSTLAGAALGWAVVRAGPAGGRLIARAAVLRTLRPWVGFALLTFGTIALTQVVQRVDLLIVEGYRGARQAGLYAVAAQIGDLMLVLPGAIGLVIFRRGAVGHAGHWDDALRSLRWTFAAGAAGALLAGALAGWLVPFLWGDAYRGSVSAARWLLPGVVALGVQSVVSNYVASRGRPRAVLVAWLTAAVVGIVGDLIVVPRYGIDGAAIVASVSYLVVLGLHVAPMRAVREAPA